MRCGEFPPKSMKTKEALKSKFGKFPELKRRGRQGLTRGWYTYSDARKRQRRAATASQSASSAGLREQEVSQRTGRPHSAHPGRISGAAFEVPPRENPGHHRVLRLRPLPQPRDH